MMGPCKWRWVRIQIHQFPLTCRMRRLKCDCQQRKGITAIKASTKSKHREARLEVINGQHQASAGIE